MDALQRDPEWDDAAGCGGDLFECRATDFGNSSCVRQRGSWLTPCEQVRDRRGIDRLGWKDAPPAIVSVSPGLNLEEHF